jgi:hypothetical protein
MSGTVEIYVRAVRDIDEVVEARVVVPATEDDLRLAAFAALQEASPKLAEELGLSVSEGMRVMMARIGVLARGLAALKGGGA